MEPYYDENGYFSAEVAEQEPLPTYMAKTFGWMGLGLLTTFAVAVAMCAGYIANILPDFFYSGAFPFVVLIAEVVVVIALSARMSKMSPNAVRVMFFAYALLNGLTFSVIFLAYNVMTLVLVFGMTMLYFGGMALYGYLTKTDLTKFGPLLFGGVIVLGVFWLLSMFLNLSGLETVMCIVGIVIFMGYTAFDVQRIKKFHAASGDDIAMAQKLSIYGALQLYLDFINLFLYLLRLFGRRSRN